MYVLQFGEVLKHTDMLLRGLLVTFQISLPTMILAFLLGTGLALCRNSKNRFLYVFSTAYVEFFRNVPILLIVYLSFYLPMELLHLRYSAIVAGIIALTLNSAAFEAETIRGGLKAIGQGQIEAAHALGLSQLQVFRYVTIPYALRIIWAALGNQAVDIVLGSSVVSVIAAPELTYEGRNVAATKSRYFEVFVILLFIYLGLSIVFSSIMRAVKKVFLKPSKLE